VNSTTCIIAVIDDESCMRRALRRLLGAHGLKVVDYPNGQDFLQALVHQPIDCIIVDLNLPGLSGRDVIAVLRARGITTPVVAISGDVDLEVPDMELLGIEAVFAKPVDELVLLQSIRSALHKVHRY